MPEQWPQLLEQICKPVSNSTASRRTPAEQLVADAWAMKRLASRLHARLLERSLNSLGEAAGAIVYQELLQLRSTLNALCSTLDTRLNIQGETDAA
jgi:hypothetical protein